MLSVFPHFSHRPVPAEKMRRKGICKLKDYFSLYKHLRKEYFITIVLNCNPLASPFYVQIESPAPESTKIQPLNLSLCQTSATPYIKRNLMHPPRLTVCYTSPRRVRLILQQPIYQLFQKHARRISASRRRGFFAFVAEIYLQKFRIFPKLNYLAARLIQN